MSWQRKIELSVMMLSLTSEIVIDEEAKLIAEALTVVKEYLKSDEFNKATDDEKNKQSLIFLMNAFDLCYPAWEDEHARMFPIELQELPFDIIKNKLIEDYLNDIKSGNDEVAGLNINEWMCENGIIIEQASSSTNESNVKLD